MADGPGHEPAPPRHPASDAPEPRVEFLSHALEELTGRSLEELSEGPEAYRSCVHPEDLPALDLLTDPGAGPSVRTAPYRLLHRDGSLTWVETVALQHRDADGTVTGLSGATRDVSASWRRAEALRSALDRERSATEELRKVARLKDALLSAVSHELRAPLTVLQGFAELLLTLGDELPPSTREEVLVDLTGLRVTADRAKLERVVENLLANAVTHGATDAPVEVRGWEDADGVTIEVADRGPGLPHELRQAVFEPVERRDADAATPGTGLGLALVRGFVELHGGRVWVEDRPGGGAAFRVWLPTPIAAQA